MKERLNSLERKHDKEVNGNKIDSYIEQINVKSEPKAYLRELLFQKQGKSSGLNFLDSQTDIDFIFQAKR